MPVEYIPQNDYLMVNIAGGGDEHGAVSKTVPEKLKTMANKNVIINLSACGDMGLGLMRELSLTYRFLKTLNGKMCLIQANPQICELIKNNGLDRILICKSDLRSALIEMGLAKEKEFDANFMNPFLLATQRVLKVQCFTDAKPQKPYVKKATDPMLLGDLSGIIGITAEAFCGTMAISFGEPLFLKIAEKMLGEKHERIIPEIVDLVGELSNMILGQAKIELNTLGYQIQQALPSCVWGKDHQVKNFGGGMCIVIPFDTPEGPFHVEISSNTPSIGAPIKT